MSYRAAVSLGSNLGDRLLILRKAIEALAGVGQVEAISSVYETAPVGGPEQGPYLNAVCILRTTSPPAALLAELHRIESEAGRVRVERWGPRVLDLDLVTVVDEAGRPVRIDENQIVLPHPRAHLRRFVLEPLGEIWPDAPLGDGMAAGEAREAVRDQEVERLGRDWVIPSTPD